MRTFSARRSVHKSVSHRKEVASGGSKLPTAHLFWYEGIYVWSFIEVLWKDKGIWLSTEGGFWLKPSSKWIPSSSRMEQLPLEMVAHILDYLDLDDLANCRLVCKSFLVATNQVKIGKMVINKLCDHIIFLSWQENEAVLVFHQKPEIQRESDPLEAISHLQNPFNFESQLKRLHLNNSNPGPSPGSSITFNHDIYFRAYLEGCQVWPLFSTKTFRFE